MKKSFDNPFKYQFKFKLYITLVGLTVPCVTTFAQTIITGTSSTVIATAGDFTIESGVIVNPTNMIAISVNGVAVTNLINNGMINTGESGGTAIDFNSTSTISTIVNNETMISKSGIQLRSMASVTNNNYMVGTDRAITIYDTASGSSVINNSYLKGNFSAISNRTTLSSIYNASGASLSGIYAVENSGLITTLSNYGSINSTHHVPNSAVNGGIITNLFNFGTISGARGGSAINSAVINLVNAQGGTAPLTIVNQPTNYSISISSPISFGKLAIKTELGSMSFEVYSGSIIESGYTYSSVLSGISATNLTITSGTFGADPWQLLETSSGSKVWDLFFPNYVVPTASIVSVGGSTSSENRRSAFGAAQVIDANQTLLDLFSDLNGSQQIADAAESTLPGVSGGVAQVTNTASNAITNVVASRQGSIRGLSSGDDMMTDRHIWFKPFGGWTEQDTRQGVTGYNIDSYGLALGFDGDVSTSWNVGFALAYINSDVKSNLTSGSHNIDMDSYIAKIYATNMLDDVTALNLQFGAGKSDYNSNRRIFTGDVANADYDSWQMQTSAELERSYSASDKIIVTPYIHADYSYVDVERYNETGAGALNLNVGNDSADSLIVGAGIKANQTVSENVLLIANAGIGYDLMTDRSSLTSSFAGGGANFTTEGIKSDEIVYNAGLGARYSLENGTEITTSYNINGRQDYTDQSISGNVRFMF